MLLARPLHSVCQVRVARQYLLAWPPNKPKTRKRSCAGVGHTHRIGILSWRRAERMSTAGSTGSRIAMWLLKVGELGQQ